MINMNNMNVRFSLFAIFLTILTFSSSSFAAPGDWLPFSAGALTLSAIIIALLYLAGIGFNLNDMKFLASEELYQFIATALMIGVLFSADASINSIFSAFGITPTLQNASITTVNNYLTIQATVFDSFKNFSKVVGRESSKNFYCSFSAMGFTVAPCGSFSSLGPAITFGLQMMSISVTETGSLLTLLKFASSYAMSLFLPFGILLRTFKFTRGAGGLLIGFAIALYLFLPLSVIFMDGITSPLAPSASSIVFPVEFSCDIHSFSDGVYTVRDISDDLSSYIFDRSGNLYNNFDFGFENAALAGGLLLILKTVLPQVIYIFLIQSTMTLVVALSAFFISMKMIARSAGSDVEIMSLMRIS